MMIKKRTRRSDKVTKGAPSGIVISLVFHAAAFFVAGLFVVFTVLPREKPVFEVPPPVERPKMKLKKPKVKIKKSSQPKPSERIVAKVKTAKMPEIQIPDLVGSGEGLLGGLGTGGEFMDLPDIPQISAYGTSQYTGTELVGVYYDLKFSNTGRYTGQLSQDNYREHVRYFINHNLNPSLLSRFYRSPRKLYTKCMVMGLEPSAMAPTAFGMPDDMCEGGSWIVHYSGSLVHKDDITFRFWGAADEFLTVVVDGEMMFATALSQERIDAVFQNDYSFPGMRKGYHWGNSNLVLPGRWITLKAGVPRKIELLIGDNPPPGRVSQCMFILAVEEKDVEYEKNYAGWPIFPVFKTSTLSHDELDCIYQITEDGIVDCVNGPIFNDYE